MAASSVCSPSALRSRLACVAACALATVLPALAAPPAPPAAPASPPAGETKPAPPAGADAAFTEADRSESSVKAARELLGKVSEAYRGAKTLSDRATIDVVTPFGPQNESLSIDLGPGRDMRVQVPQMVITVFGEKLFVEIDQFADERFVGVPIKDGDIAATLETVAPGFALPLPHLALRESKDEAKWLEAFSAGALEEIVLAGHRINDKKQSEILLKASNGVGIATVDPETKLLEGILVDFAPPGAPPGLGIKVTFGFDPKVADALEKPIGFEPGSRKQVATIEDLMQKLMIGDAAPDFELATHSGDTVKLSELVKENVVVLDLWATWCGPCRRALPLLDQFAKWTVESGKPVKVFGVNVWESQGQESTAEERKARAIDYWTKAGLSFPTLLDLEDKLASDLGPNGIPTTYVIGRDGKIAAIHSGFSAEMVEMLKADVEKLLPGTSS